MKSYYSLLKEILWHKEAIELWILRQINLLLPLTTYQLELMI